MSLRGVCALVLFFVVSPAEAHCFRIWRYHTPQMCHTERIRHAYQHVSALRQHPPALPTIDHREGPEIQEQSTIGLPGLEAVDWGYADYYGMPVERIRAIALLRALSDGQR
jgi:hypothetical protein